MILSYFIFLGSIALLVILSSKKAQKKAEQKEKERLEKERKRKEKLEKINKFKEEVEKYGLEGIKVKNLILSHGEVCFYSENVNFKKVLKTKEEVYTGVLYITNKQFIFTSESFKVSRKIGDIAYIDNPKGNILSLQIGKTWYELEVPGEVEIFEIILREAIKQHNENNPRFLRRVVCEYCGVENLCDSKSKVVKCSNCTAPLQRVDITG